MPQSPLLHRRFFQVIFHCRHYLSFLTALEAEGFQVEDIPEPLIVFSPLAQVHLALLLSVLQTLQLLRSLLRLLVLWQKIIPSLLDILPLLLPFDF